MKTKHLISILIIAVLAVFAGCNEDEPAVTACFEMTSASLDDDSDPIVGEDIDFENCSENATEYAWDFGDGEDSDDENPTHSYTEPGDYTVSLTATGAGGSNTVEKDITIQATVTGTWEGEMTIDGSTDVYPIVFELEQDGSDLTGSFQFGDGSGYSTLSSTSNIDGQDITIKFVEPSYGMNFTFTGEVNDDFDQMGGSYTMTMSGGGLNGDWTVDKTGKKATIRITGKGLDSFRKKI